MKNLNHLFSWTMIGLVLTTSQTFAQSTYEPYRLTTLAGSTISGSTDGTGRAARFWDITGLAVDRAGNIYVVDTGHSTIRKVTSAGVVTTLAEKGSPIIVYSSLTWFTNFERVQAWPESCVSSIPARSTM